MEEIKAGTWSLTKPLGFQMEKEFSWNLTPRKKILKEVKAFL